MGSHLSSTPRAEIWTALLLGPLTKTHTTRTNTEWGLKTSSQTKGGNDDARESGAEGKKDREKPENETKIKQKVLQRLKGEFFFVFCFFGQWKNRSKKALKRANATSNKTPRRTISSSKCFRLSLSFSISLSVLTHPHPSNICPPRR